ncbi:MAG TPA: GvpL/GvpF family gas vesicle protein [Gemmatimonadaceae bacterium]|nr:GvpL/GvpF family gas vesicle protein [Gemmatimonadaceae bacterium]
MAAAAVSAVRLYGVTAAHGHHGSFTVDTGVVAFRELAAIVADAPYETAADLGLEDYRRVVESVFRQQALVPAPPGVVFRSRDVLAQWLELHYFTLLDALAFIEDRAVARVSVVPEPPAAPGAEAGAAEGSDERAEEVLHDALRLLRRHAAATVTLGPNGGGHPTAASFLVDRSRWEVFTELVREESGRVDGYALALTGPWPPYDFIRMQFSN